MDIPEPTLPGGKVWSVSEITAQVKSIIEESLPPLWVEGEISNFTHHSSGHMYFSLKDEGAQLRAVFFRGVFLRVVLLRTVFLPPCPSFGSSPFILPPGMFRSPLRSGSVHPR